MTPNHKMTAHFELTRGKLDSITIAISLLHGCVLAVWFVEHLAGEDPAEDFLEQESLLLLDFLEEASVLVGPPREVGQDLHHGSVWYVFVG